MATDWNAPVRGNARQQRQQLHLALGVREEHFVRLQDRLLADLKSGEFGHDQFDDVDDARLRAVASDQMRMALGGVNDNLIEARLAELDVIETAGPNGLARPHAGSSLNDHMPFIRLNRFTAEFFRAYWSTLDCLAGVVVGVLRFPFSIWKADFDQLVRWDPEKYARGATVTHREQHELWREGHERLLAFSASDPVGWYVWAIEMRNAFTHRGRSTHKFMPRPNSPELALPGNPVPGYYSRFDLHFPRQPWLAEVELLARGPALTETLLREPVQVTTAEMRETLNDFTEDLCAWLLEVWDEEDSARRLRVSAKRWRLHQEPDPGFVGMVPDHPQAELVGAAVGDDGFLRLAMKLRELPELNDGPDEISLG